MTCFLFVCGHNQLRSPTAEHLYATTNGLDVRSAGLRKDSPTVLTADLLAWADVIFVMEPKHERELLERFADVAPQKSIVCLDIPDQYDYLSPDLIELLTVKLTPYLGPPHQQ